MNGLQVVEIGEFEFESEIIMKKMLECKGELVSINGHYIHHYKSDEMCKEIIEFVNALER